MCRFLRFGLTLAVALILAAPAGAQTTTGRLIGNVVGNGGETLPGVTMTIESEALLGGPRTEITDENGEFAFLGLAPGTYRVRSSLAGFATQERIDVKVPLGGATKITIEMPAGTFAGEIAVVAETPVVDPTQVSMAQVFDQAYLKNAAIGSSGRSYQSVLIQAAGADNSVESATNPSVFGSTSGENSYYIDGMDTTDPITSTHSHNFNFDAIQEVQFQTAGFEAEYGRALGGVVNLVTKSGGNTFSGTLDARYRDQSFYTSGDHYDASELNAQRYNLSLTLGGPILRDRLWFFASYEYVRNQQTPTFSDNTYDFEGTYPFLKLSWQVDPSWRVVAKYSGDPVTIDNANALTTNYVDPATMASRDQGGHVTTADVSAVLSNALLWNTNLGQKRSELNQLPKTDVSVIPHRSYYDGLYRDNYDRQELGNRDRDEFATDLTWFVDDLAGSHELKFGVEYGKFMENSSTICNSGVLDGAPGGCGLGTQGSYYYDNRRYEDFEHPYYWYITDSIPPEDFVGTMSSGFVQDAWRLRPNLTLKIGLRYDDMTWKDNTGAERIWFDKLQPRLGVAWDVTRDARNVVRANWGRFMHPANSSVPSFLTTTGGGRYYYAGCSYGAYRVGVGDMHLTPDQCQAIAADIGWDYITDPNSWDPSGWIGPFATYAGLPTEVDPNLRPAYADEWAVSYERALWNRSSVEIAFVNKATRDILEDTCRGNFYDGPSEDADCEAYLIFNHPKRDYRGATIKFETRSLDWMTLIASYTYSEAKGSADTRHYFNGDWDTYPWEWMNMYGYTMHHRPHRVKLNGFFLLPYDFTVGFDSWWADKFRYNTLDNQYPGAPAGIDVFAEPRGTREANSNYQIDLQVAKGFEVGPVRLELIATVINVTSAERPEDAQDVCEYVGGCADPEGDGVVGLGDPIEWQDPRRYELGFRIEF